MARYLALDTCTEICSAGLWVDGEMRTRVSTEPRRHTQLLLPMVDELLAESGTALKDLDGLFCTRGPGSFTGVRIGISAVQGMAFAANLPVWPLSTLAVLALQGSRMLPGHEEWAVAMDARMGEAYVAGYRLAGDAPPAPVGNEALIPLDQVVAHLTADAPNAGRIGAAWALAGVGSSFDTGADSGTIPPDLPGPEAVLRLGISHVQAGTPSVLPDALQPVYLRDQVAHRPST